MNGWIFGMNFEPAAQTADAAAFCGLRLGKAIDPS
jgi:hypothetical protein